MQLKRARLVSAAHRRRPWASPRTPSAVGSRVPATAVPRRCGHAPRPGRPPQLSAAQKRLIPEFLWHGPEAYGFRGRGLDLRPRRPGHRGGVRRPLPQGPRRPAAQGTALDAPGADPAGHPAGRGGHPALARRGLAGPATAGAARAPGAGFRGRIGVLPAAGVGQDLRPRGADAGHPREADARPPVGHGRDDARRARSTPWRGRSRSTGCTASSSSCTCGGWRASGCW